MIFARGHRRDYDLWRQQGLKGWSYADVLPYFKRLESSWRGESEYHGGYGPDQGHAGLPRSRTCYEPMRRRRELRPAGARRLQRRRHRRHQPMELFVGGGERQSSGARYLHPVMRRPNLTVETGALTTRILIENGRANGIEYMQDGQKKLVYADREVIISGGAYNSPQLLMLSGIGPADHLKSVGVDAGARSAGRRAEPRRASQHAADVQGEAAGHVSSTSCGSTAQCARRALASVPQRRVHQQRHGGGDFPALPAASRAAGHSARVLGGRQ